MELIKLRRLIEEIKKDQANIPEPCERLISPEQYHTIMEAAEAYHDQRQEEIESKLLNTL